MTTFALGHISDLHVLDWGGVTVRAMASKRITGLANLVLGRRDAHPPALAAALAVRLRAAALDHVAFTGDLTNLALPGEFSRGVELLRAIGDGAILSAVPGNHDAYAADAIAERRAELALAPWTGGAIDSEAWPYRKELRPWLRLYGLHSAIAAPPLCAWGEVGAAQRARLQAQIEAEGPAPCRRIALVHHNVHDRGPWHDATAQLRDRYALIDLLARLGFDALLHGHSHRPHRAWRARRDGGRLWLLGCGSSTWHRPRSRQFAHWSCLTWAEDGLRGLRSEVWSDAAGGFVVEEPDCRGAVRELSWR